MDFRMKKGSNVQEKQVKYIKTGALPSASIYIKAELAPLPPLEFELANRYKGVF